MLIEIIVTSVEEALLAEQYGANRLELINSFDLGGLSPNPELAKEVCNAVKIPVNIMLRPHGNGFVYNNDDISTIINELEYLKNNTKANGIAFGALDKGNLIDTKLLQDVISHKGRLQLVFHRAIDVAEDTFEAYQKLICYEEIDAVLTSGGKPTATEGQSVIKHMIELGSPFRHCQIIAGSGITPENAKDIIQKTGTRQIHLGSGVRTSGLLDKTKFYRLIRSIKN